MSLRERNEELARKLASLKTVGDAWALSIAALREAKAAHDSLGGFVDPASTDINRRLGDCITDVTRYLAPLEGDDTMALPEASWKPLRRALGNLYALMWAIEEQHPEAARSTSWQMFGEILTDTVNAVPESAKRVLDYAGELAGGVAGAGAAAVSKTLWELVKGAWPIFLVAGVVVAGGVYLAATHPGAVAKIKVAAA